MPFSSRIFRRLRLTSRKSFLFLITLLLLSSTSAYAEWVELASTQNQNGYYTVYADPDTIRRNEEMVTMWVLFDFAKTQTVASHLILSFKGQDEHDCDGRRHRVLALSWFSGNMGGGNEVNRTPGESIWVSVDPKSVVHSLWKFACGKK